MEHALPTSPRPRAPPDAALLVCVPVCPGMAWILLLRAAAKPLALHGLIPALRRMGVPLEDHEQLLQRMRAAAKDAELAAEALAAQAQAGATTEGSMRRRAPARSEVAPPTPTVTRESARAALAPPRRPAPLTRPAAAELAALHAKYEASFDQSTLVRFLTYAAVGWAGSHPAMATITALGL